MSAAMLNSMDKFLRLFLKGTALEIRHTRKRARVFINRKKYFNIRGKFEIKCLVISFRFEYDRITNMLRRTDYTKQRNLNIIATHSSFSDMSWAVMLI